MRALAAEGYIGLLALGVVYVPRLVTVPDVPVLGITCFLSLFVFSAASMGYLFLAKPLLLVVEGKYKEAVSFFLQTVFFFALTSIAVVGGLFLIWFR